MKYIIDCDTGVDDAMAITMVLSNTSEDDVIGITCVAGNTPLDEVVKNTFVTMEICKRTEIPVYCGAVKPLLNLRLPNSGVHGSDGLGDVRDKYQGEECKPQREHAANALVRLANEHPGEITLLCLAPLTNIAIATKLAPGIGEKFKEIFIMGGNLNGKGNSSPCAEFNFRCDPEAAKIVLNETKGRKYLVSMDVCRDLPLSYKWIADWISRDTEKGRFTKDINKKLIEYYINVRKMKHYHTYDPVAAAVMLDQSLIEECFDHYCTVETSGEHTRGMMIVDVNEHFKSTPNLSVITKINPDRFVEFLDKMLN